MLQRAASNAYSWWWASNIRTKQSKWLDSDLEEMEGRIKAMLKIVEQDGDSFGKKAEIYFKKRPELVQFVEETYKAYKALADRYDHISSELHKVNHTLATAFPDQIQFEDDDDVPKSFTSIDASKIRKPSADIPPTGLMTRRKDQAALKKSRHGRAASQNSKDKAQEEIDKLQKGILVLQTEKEYIKSSCETGMSNYWDIEKQITEMQEEIFFLEDEFGASVAIEDDEARALMAVTALKSCEGSLAKLEEQQKRSMEEVRTESEKIMAANEKAESLRGASGLPEEFGDVSNESNMIEEASQNEDSPDSDLLSDTFMEKIVISSVTSVEELAEKINELVAKVIEMDTTSTSQIAQIKRLRAEADKLQRYLQTFEEEKKTLVEESNSLRDQLKMANEKLMKSHESEKHVLDKKSMVDIVSSLPNHGLDDISVAPVPPKHQDQFNTTGLSREMTYLNNTEVTRVGEKEVKETLELDLDENSMFDKVSTESGLGVGDILERSMSPKQQDCVILSGQSQEDGSELQREKSPINSVSKEVKKEGEQSQGIRELGHGLMVQTIVDPSEAGYNLKVNSDKSEATKHEVEINLSCDNDNVHQSDESKLQIEECFDHFVEGSHLEDCSVESQAVEHELEISPSHGDDNILQNTEAEPQFKDQAISLNWLQSLVDGLEGKEKMILTEYTSVLRSYKDMKARFSEVEKKTQEDILQTMLQIKELESDNAMKDQEIHSLRKSLRSARSVCDHAADVTLTGSSSKINMSSGSENAACKSTARRFQSFDASDRNIFANKDIKAPANEWRAATSAIEEKFRKDIDAVLEENLEFWLRYSTSFHGIQKFQTAFPALQAEIKKLKHKKLGEVSSPAKKANNPNSLHIDRKLRELKTELQVWLEQNMLLQGELESKFSSISSMQEEISGTLEASLEASLEADVAKFAPYQAAKFQGELLNMQLENNKVAEELKAGLEHVRVLHGEVEKTLSRLHERFELPKLDSSELQKDLTVKNRVPLRSFLFTPKPKRKPSIFACVHPALHKHLSSGRSS